MRLDDSEIRDLAGFLARRCGPEGGPPGFGAEAHWVVRLHDAQADNALGPVVRSVAARWPQDENLQAAVRILAPRPSRLPIAVAAMAASLVFGLGGVGLAWKTAQVLNGAPTLVAAAQPPVVAASAPVLAPLQPQSVIVVPQAPATVVANTAPVVAPQRVLTVKGAAGPAGSPCGSAPTSAVGWWHAGERKPGAVGDVVTVRQAVNVRSFFPNEQNRYSMRSDVLCVLDSGAQLRLSGEPVRIPGNSWWVPVSGGDIMDDAVAAAN